jgi:hypothetical protein
MNTLIVAAGLTLWLTVLVVDAVVRDRRRRQLQRDRLRMQRDFDVLYSAGKYSEATAKLSAMERLEAGVR